MIWDVPLFDLDYGEAEEQAALDVLRSRWLTQGEKVAGFERAFASAVGARFAVAVSSCTAGLHLAAHALGIGPGDEVILPSLTFVATANTIVQTGATPVFADIESYDRPLLDAADVARKITPHTRAIVAVHYAGWPCDMTALTALAQSRGLHLIEDCAHAPLAAWQGRKVGTFGAAGVFSFFSNKNLSTGEGGMIVTDDEELARRFALLRSHGMTHPTLERHKGHAADYDVVELGFNYRMDEIRAAIGLVQLQKLAANNARRAECAAHYRELLRGIEWIRIPFGDEKTLATSTGVHHIFPVILGGHLEEDAKRTSRTRPTCSTGPTDGKEERACVSRAEVMRTLRERSIQTSIHYRPVHTFAFYRQRFPTPDAALSTTCRIAPRLLTLPLYPSLTAAQREKVAAALRESQM
ncbi:MAG: DegT/DnrJ/EryC1/StrS family aminotransferase [Candidatus Sumerlaeia bacterium]|nr:DegT/DnrJ/EryC1/StrS family aminotransferase [Candidatus Sumerlaeia bacterium]